MPGMNSNTPPAERCGNCAHRVRQVDASDPAALAHASVGMAPCRLAHPQRAMSSSAPCAHTPSRWATVASPKH